MEDKNTVSPKGSFEGGGINTNESASVTQYFKFYSKLQNQ